MPHEIHWVVKLLEIACIAIFAVAISTCLAFTIESRFNPSLDARGRRAARALWTITTAFFYAYGIEHACVWFGTYTYPGSAFGLHFRGARGIDVPLWIGMGWGTVVYFCTFTATRLKLGRFATPLAAGLLALNVDLSLDPIATHFGAWVWKMGLPQGFYGVPWQNFVGWFCIVAGFTTIAQQRVPIANRLKDWICTRWGWQDHDALPTWIRVLVHTTTTLAVAIAAFALVGGVLFVADVVYKLVLEVSIFAIIYTVAMVVVVFKLGLLYADDKRGPNYRPNWYVWAMPMSYHAIFVYLWCRTRFQADTGHVQYTIFFMALLAGLLFGYPAIDSAVTIARKTFDATRGQRFKMFWMALLSDNDNKYDDSANDYF